ncbi:hypothetical protein [Pyrococcus yayanosii]|uniref:hypothetical protein n=1 Tax=Pyrococcus yayanosii TaxID=1008460 RepID=UPI0011D2B37E|nr:hypothetical protein [Pyrococcus yayanosii]
MERYKMNTKRRKFYGVWWIVLAIIMYSCGPYTYVGLNGVKISCYCKCASREGGPPVPTAIILRDAT